MELSEQLDQDLVEIVNAREKFYSTLEEGMAKLVGDGNDRDANGEPVYTLSEDQGFLVFLKNDADDYWLQSVCKTGITADGFDYDWKFVETDSIMEIVRFLENLHQQN